MRISVLKSTLPLTFLMMLTGVSFSAQGTALTRAAAAVASDASLPSSPAGEGADSSSETTNAELNFEGQIISPPCFISELATGRLIQTLPLYIGEGAGLKRIDNYVINFEGCALDPLGLPFADLTLTQMFGDKEKERVFTTPQFKMIRHGDSAVDTIKVPLSSDTDTIINIGLPNGTPLPGLLYLRAYYPIGSGRPSAPYDSVTLEVNYK